MKFFLDTASIKEIKKWSEYNLVQGVTTNPSLLSKEKNETTSQLKKICSIVKGPVSAQVTKVKHINMIKQAMSLKNISKNIVIKLPPNNEGFLAAKFLKKKKIKINVTASFSPAQIISFARINVDYFSLILGKTRDWGFSNLNSIAKSKNILKLMNSKTELILASVRNEDDLINSIINGADVVTVAPSAWEKTFNNKFSKLTIKAMLKDWSNLSRNNRKKYEIEK